MAHQYLPEGSLSVSALGRGRSREIRPPKVPNYLIRKVSVPSSAGPPCAVCHNHPGPQFRLLTIAFCDAVLGHDLNIVLMRSDT
jgi:hypothetical protein